MWYQTDCENEQALFLNLFGGGGPQVKFFQICDGGMVGWGKFMQQIFWWGFKRRWDGVWDHYIVALAVVKDAIESTLFSSTWWNFIISKIW